jgi:hypothetical protein
VFVIQRRSVSVLDATTGETTAHVALDTSTGPVSRAPTIDPAQTITECAC